MRGGKASIHVQNLTRRDVPPDSFALSIMELGGRRWWSVSDAQWGIPFSLAACLSMPHWSTSMVPMVLLAKHSTRRCWTIAQWPARTGSWRSTRPTSRRWRLQGIWIPLFFMRWGTSLAWGESIREVCFVVFSTDVMCSSLQTSKSARSAVDIMSSVV